MIKKTELALYWIQVCFELCDYITVIKLKLNDIHSYSFIKGFIPYIKSGDFIENSATKTCFKYFIYAKIVIMKFNPVTFEVDQV
jgi:hypothetical protein